jgi:hypothetical protein
MPPGYLWPALRQLASVPYDDPQFAAHRSLWEKLAGAWDHSAAWYGLHDDSPIGKLLIGVGSRRRSAR